MTLGLAEKGVEIDPFAAVIAALGLIYGAYLTDVLRGGIQAVPKGQIEAAKAFVATTYQGSPVTMNASFNVLATGLSYMNFADIQIPAKQMEVQVSNFNYNKNN